MRASVRWSLLKSNPLCIIGGSFLLALLLGSNAVNAIAWDTDLTQGSWWCTTSNNTVFSIMERKLDFYDMSRILATGKTTSALCNLYFVNEDIPYSMMVDWDEAWNATGSNVKLSLYTRFTFWETWRLVWEVKGEAQNGFSSRADTTRMARFLFENPDREEVNFRITIRPTYGLAIDMEPWLWAIIVIAIVVGFVLLGLAAFFIYIKCKNK